MTKQEADFIGSMNMCDEISNEAYKKIMCNCEVEEQQPCEDCISRQAVLRCIKESREGIDWGQSEDEDAFLHYTAALYRTIASKECLPPVIPKYTDEEIQKIQELEQAQLDKAYELGKTESFEDWLSSFNTESATCCFTAVQQLKEKINGKME